MVYYGKEVNEVLAYRGSIRKRASLLDRRELVEKL